MRGIGRGLGLGVGRNNVGPEALRACGQRGWADRGRRACGLDDLGSCGRVVLGLGVAMVRACARASACAMLAPSPRSNMFHYSTLCYSATLLICYSAPLPLCYSATLLLLCYSATRLLCYSTTLLLCYSATILYYYTRLRVGLRNARSLPLQQHQRGASLEVGEDLRAGE